jgi:hypothetical protein
MFLTFPLERTRYVALKRVIICFPFEKFNKGTCPAISERLRLTIRGFSAIDVQVSVKTKWVRVRQLFLR